MDKGWPPKPWTIVTEEKWGSEGLEDWGYYAVNIRTSERKPLRATYDAAMKDIPESPNAEPWGV